MTPNTHLTTERLLLRPYELGDVADLHRTLHGDAAVMRFLPGGVALPIERSQKSAEYAVKHWQDHGYGGFAVIHREDRAFIGQCGLNRMSDGEVEIFYALAAPYWGRGLATEAARAMLDFGFRVAGLTRIIGLTYPENAASQHVLLKLGMTAQGTTERYYAMTMAYFVIERTA
jgi:[ribosomal protein S5]-alanine N-acetyltransferase